MNKKHEEEIIEVFLKAGGSRELMRDFLQDILTPAELQEVMIRWQIVKRLAKGDAQRTIAKELHIGIGTVTRGSRELADENGGFSKVLRKIKI